MHAKVPVNGKTLSGLFVFLTLATPTWAATEEPANWIIFWGRFHPLFVHLPIGFLLVAFLLEIMALWPRYQALKPAVTFILLLGVISAVTSAVLGYLLSLGGGYDEQVLFWHQWLGIGVAVASVIAYWIKRTAGNRRLSPALAKAYLPIFSLSIVALMGAGHYGGSLTHGSDYLTQYMPATMRKVAGLPPPPVKIVSKPITNVQEALVYADIIHPIFDSRCISCHNPSKKKGDLRMDSPEELLKGGKHGKVLETGNPDKSEIIKRALLPEDDDHHMPPKGKTPLTQEQIALVGWWIKEGAPLDKKVAQLKVTPEVQPALASLGDGASGGPQGIFALKVPAADPKAVEDVRQLGFQVMTIAQDNHYLQAKYLRSTEAFTQQQVQNLLPLAKQITWLDLSDAQNLAQGVANLGKLTNLTRLHLENSGVTDTDLAGLKSLDKLEYLNLYGTAITDSGLQQLAGLKNLKSLYIWKTNVSPEGIKALQQRLPQLHVDTGLTPDSIVTMVKTSKKGGS